jgi:hypothetical protein
MNVELLLTLAALVNRAVEAVKRLPAFGRIPDAWRDEVLLIVSTVFGILAVGLLAPDQNLLADMPGVHVLIGKAFTGVVVASGANAIHFVIDVINRRNPDVAPSKAA